MLSVVFIIIPYSLLLFLLFIVFYFILSMFVFVFVFYLSFYRGLSPKPNGPDPAAQAQQQLACFPSREAHRPSWPSSAQVYWPALFSHVRPTPPTKVSSLARKRPSYCSANQSPAHHQACPPPNTRS